VGWHTRYQNYKCVSTGTGRYLKDGMLLPKIMPIVPDGPVFSIQFKMAPKNEDQFHVLYLNSIFRGRRFLFEARKFFLKVLLAFFIEKIMYFLQNFFFNFFTEHLGSTKKP
jgi:hypothetical protein